MVSNKKDNNDVNSTESRKDQNSQVVGCDIINDDSTFDSMDFFIGLFLITLALSFVIISADMPLHGKFITSPGSLPFMIGMTLLSLCIIYYIGIIKSLGNLKMLFPTLILVIKRTETKRFTIISMILFLYVYLIGRLPFEWVSFGFLIVMYLFLHKSLLNKKQIIILLVIAFFSSMAISYGIPNLLDFRLP